MIREGLVILLGAFLLQNFILHLGLGLVAMPSRKSRLRETARLALGVIGIATVTGALAALLDHYALGPLALDPLRILIWLVILAFLDDFLRSKTFRVPHNGGAALLAIALLSREFRYNLFESTCFGFGSGLGIALILVILAGILERLELADLPRRWEGVPILWISLGILSLAFLGFQGLLKGLWE